jgi:hypothetical protein
MDIIRNLVIVSDLHCGCRLGLCPPDGITLDEGGTVGPSDLQRKVWEWWREFWDDFVPHVCHGEPFAVVVNGDAIDGVHHGSVTQISHHLGDQNRLAVKVLEPIVKACEGRYYHIRGTEAHVGKSGQEEERLAAALNAVPNEQGQHARWELWARVGRGLVHLSHHIGTTGSMHYESTALMRELTEAYVEAGRWGEEPPDVVVRSHRHRSAEVRVQTRKGFATVVTTPGWQLKTPFVYKIPGGRQSQPQIGGLVVRCGDDDVYTRPFVRSLSRPREEVL